MSSQRAEIKLFLARITAVILVYVGGGGGGGMAIDLRVRCHSLLFGPVRGIAVFYCCNFKLYKLRPLILR